MASVIVFLVFVLVLWVSPIAVAYALCDAKNRNSWKGMFLALFFGWFAVVGLWLGLKKRDAETGVLR